MPIKKKFFVIFPSGGGNGNLLQYSWLEYSIDRGAWQVLWGHKRTDMTDHMARILLVLFILMNYPRFLGLPWWLNGKESTCNAGDVGLSPGLERASGEGNGNPLQYSCLENPMDRGP